MHPSCRHPRQDTRHVLSCPCRVWGTLGDRNIPGCVDMEIKLNKTYCTSSSPDTPLCLEGKCLDQMQVWSKTRCPWGGRSLRCRPRHGQRSLTLQRPGVGGSPSTLFRVIGLYFWGSELVGPFPPPVWTLRKGYTVDRVYWGS